MNTNWNTPGTLKNSFPSRSAKGDKIKAFIVHEEVACHYSPVLKAAFNSDFVEGQTQTYVLDDIGEHGIATFTLFVEWLYTQKLDLLQELKYIVDGDKEYRTIPANIRRIGAAEIQVAEMWIIAGKLLVPSLQNLAIEQLERISYHAKGVPSGVLKNYIFAKHRSRQSAPNNLEYRTLEVIINSSRLRHNMIGLYELPWCLQARKKQLACGAYIGLSWVVSRDALQDRKSPQAPEGLSRSVEIDFSARER